MMKVYTFLIVALIASYSVHATSYFWKGPINGKWSDSLNWSRSPGSTGGTGVPEAGDEALFSFIYNQANTVVVDIDISPTVKTLYIGSAVNAIFYTSVNTTFTVIDQLEISKSLTDSTSENVRFDFILDHAKVKLVTTELESARCMMYPSCRTDNVRN